jgi:hypothetical protein
MKAASKTDECARMKRLEIQRGVIQHPTSLRIAAEKNLKSPIQLEAFHTIRTGTPTDLIRALKDRTCKTGLRQTTSTGQPGKTGTDNTDSRSSRHQGLL